MSDLEKNSQSDAHAVLLKHLNCDDDVASCIHSSFPNDFMPLPKASSPGAKSKQNWAFEMILGTRTFRESDLLDQTLVDLSQIVGVPLDDPMMLPEEKRTKQISKQRFVLFKDASSTSVPAGYRVAGISGPGSVYAEQGWPLMILKKTHSGEFLEAAFLKNFFPEPWDRSEAASLAKKEVEVLDFSLS